MKLVITIDTEEDNWAGYSETDFSVENIAQIVKLQSLFDKYNIMPTYLITYAVASDPSSVAILKEIIEHGKCEIGSHCHPWNTPPFEEDKIPWNSMLCNLPERLQLLKLERLHEKIQNNFGMTPVSFRAGRWGFSASVGRAISRLGYRIDTSVTPYTDWSVYQGPNFSEFNNKPYRFDPDISLLPKVGGKLLQIPASIGFLQGNFGLSHWLSHNLEKDIFKNLHLRGVLSRLGLLNKVWLSPEQFNAETMKKLAAKIIDNNISCLNMVFHSTSLMAGFSPFVASKEDEVEIFDRIEEFLQFSNVNGYESMTLSQFENHFSSLPENKLKLNVL